MTAAVRAVCGLCGAPGRQFFNRYLCGEHAPTVPVPDPDRTAAALLERRRRQLTLARTARR